MQIVQHSGLHEKESSRELRVPREGPILAGVGRVRKSFAMVTAALPPTLSWNMYRAEGLLYKDVLSWERKLGPSRNVGGRSQ
jgi:hypothetical protein